MKAEESKTVVLPLAKTVMHGFVAAVGCFVVAVPLVLSCGSTHVGYLYVDKDFTEKIKSCADLYILPTVNTAAKTKYDNPDPFLCDLVRERMTGGKIVPPGEIIASAKDKNLSERLELLLKRYAEEERVDQESLAALSGIFGEGYVLFSWVTELKDNASLPPDTGSLSFAYLQGQIYCENKPHTFIDKVIPGPVKKDHPQGKHHHKAPHQKQYHHAEYHYYHYPYNHPYFYDHYYYPYPYYPYDYPQQPAKSYEMGGALTMVEVPSGKKVYETSFRGYYGYGSMQERVRLLFAPVVKAMPRCGATP